MKASKNLKAALAAYVSANYRTGLCGFMLVETDDPHSNLQELGKLFVYCGLSIKESPFETFDEYLTRFGKRLENPARLLFIIRALTNTLSDYRREPE